ncbi:MAG: GGDEF domain-containing protein [Endomicrobium sp.]|nr:GGDEF domain-containing protein [Endomicrobium sp.]
MNRKILNLIYILLTLAVLYFLMPSSGGAIVWASFISLAGFYYAQWFKKAVFITSSIACAIALFFVKEYPFSTLSACLIFISLIPLPYYFYIKSGKLKKDFSAKIRVLKIKHSEILEKYKESFDERQKYEDETERIIQFYVACKKLSNCAVEEEYVKIILNALDEKARMIGCSILEKIKFEWKLLASSGILKDKDLVPYVHSLKFLGRDKNFNILDSLYSKELDNRNFGTIYWPLKIEEELLGCIVIVTEMIDVDRYMEEGLIFAPHISLGLKRINLFDEISEKSRIDGLTGLYLRRYFLNRLDAEIQRDRRYSDGFYILMLDLDRFKNVNDKYGHLTGDKVLASIAKIISSSVRPCDLVGRYGGEEFVVLIPSVNEKEVQFIAQKIKKSVKDAEFEENDEKFNITVSIGISYHSSKSISNSNFVINTADKALYKAKNTGRDRIVMYADMSDDASIGHKG